MSSDYQPPEPVDRGEGESLYAVSYPPAMYARDVLEDQHFAQAMGYGWLHEEQTEFVRTFKEQVRRQAEIYENWLSGDDPGAAPSGTTEQPAAEETG
jgi:hypothetical protein